MKHIKPFTIPMHYCGNVHVYDVSYQEILNWITGAKTDHFYVAIDDDCIVYLYTNPPIIEDPSVYHFIYDNNTYILKLGKAAIEFEYKCEFMFTVTGYTVNELLDILKVLEEQ